MLPRAPFVSVVIFFATGILFGDALRAAVHVPVALFWAVSGLLGIGCGLFYHFKKSTAFAVGLGVWMVLLGAVCQITAEEGKDASIAALDALEYTSFTAEVTSLPEKRANSIRFEVDARRFLSGEHWIGQPVRALLYLPDSLRELPQPGDHIVIHGHLQQPEPPQNPEQFNYARYLRNKGILFTAFVRSGSFAIVPKPAKSGPLYWPEAVSKWADEQFRTHINDPAAYGLVKAMLLGRRDDLLAEQTSDYTISGAVHILSVSGMHVAIIFLAISAAFGWLRKWAFGKWVYLLIMAGLLGFYALVTGLPPSVQRAALMCMMLVIAEVAGRRHYPMNTLAFSALVILLCDPCALYDVGFQLSYLAMAGIFLLYGPIERIVFPQNRALRFVWQVTALAFAAQIATFPLSLYYFHQFPTYFWLVNPLVVLFTNVLLPAALVLLLVSACGLPWLPWLVGKVAGLSAWLTDWAASIPHALPGHLLENLHLEIFEVMLLYALIFLVWYTLHSRSLSYLKASVVVVVLFAAGSVMSSLNTYLKPAAVTLTVPGHHATAFKRGNALYIVSNRSFPNDVRTFDFNVKNYAVSMEIERIINVIAP